MCTVIRHLKTNVGTALNKALEALEDANVDALQDVLKGISFNRKVGPSANETQGERRCAVVGLSVADKKATRHHTHNG